MRRVLMAPAIHARPPASPVPVRFEGPVMITGGAPETGFRVVLERSRETETPPCTYSGSVELPDVTYEVVAEVAEDRSVRVSVAAPDGPARDLLVEKIRLIVRQVVKDSDASSPLSRKIVRWRGEK